MSVRRSMRFILGLTVACRRLQGIDGPCKIGLNNHRSPGLHFFFVCMSMSLFFGFSRALGLDNMIPLSVVQSQAPSKHHTSSTGRTNVGGASIPRSQAAWSATAKATHRLVSDRPLPRESICASLLKDLTPVHPASGTPGRVFHSGVPKDLSDQ